MDGSVVVVGGTSGLGREVARRYAERGAEVVITGRDASRAEAVARELGGSVKGLALDLTRPEEIAGNLSPVGPVRYLVLAAIDRDENSVRDYAMDRAGRLARLKLVGYTEVVHVLVDRMDERSAIVLFGGLAKDRPYPGSVTVSTVNGAVSGLVRALAIELAPIRVNAIHPGIVGDSPYWSAKPAEVLERFISRTPLGRLVTMAEVADGVEFLLENTGVNGEELRLDGGWMLT